MCDQYRHKGFHCCFRRLPAKEHSQQCLHELIRLRRTRSAVRWRRSLTGRSRHRHRGRWRWRCRMRRWQTHRRRRTRRRLRRKFRLRLNCASKSLRRNVSCCKRSADAVGAVSSGPADKDCYPLIVNNRSCSSVRDESIGSIPWLLHGRPIGAGANGSAQVEKLHYY